MKLKRSLIALSCIVMCSGTVLATGIDSLTNLLAEQGVITYGQAQQIITESKEKERQELASGKSKSVPQWVQNLSLKGDLRLRTQADWDKSNNTRIRERLRFRLGAETRPVDNIEIGFGLATGALKDDADSNPNSTNHTFAAMNKAPLFVDYAYVKYTPSEWLTLNGGKVKGKTQVWNASDLIWDGDYNPDGINANIKTSLSDGVTLSANAGYYIFGEGRKGNLLADGYIAQPVIEYKYGNISLKAGIAYQQFNFADKTDMGSNLNTGYDYRIINPGIELKIKEIIKSLGITIYGDYANNSQSDLPKVDDKDAKTGYLYGVKFGHDKISQFGTWQINAMYRYLDKYAIPEGLGDSDAYGGKAGKGYEITATVGLVKNFSLGIDYYEMTNTNGDAPKSLCQMDLVYKF